MLKEIPKNIANLIKSQQYIHSTYIIAKELIENALDADSTNIKVIISDTSITVEDNGNGIEDLEVVCKAGYTSKEDTTFKALGIEYTSKSFTHGFRGQALSSINELCTVVISSRCRSSSKDEGQIRNFTTGEMKRYPREFGTTVKVSDIFKNCAIRKQQNEKSRRKNLMQILALIQSFCYIYDVHFTLLDKDKVLFAERGSSNTKEFAIKKHGDRYLEVEDEKFYFLLFPLCKDKVQVMINEKRIVNSSRITNIITGVFKRHFDYLPTFLIIFKDKADFNISADKMEIILKNTKYIENKIKSETDLYFSSKMFIHSSEDKRVKKKSSILDESILTENTAASSMIYEPMNSEIIESPPKRRPENILYSSFILDDENTSFDKQNDVLNDSVNYTSDLNSIQAENLSLHSESSKYPWRAYSIIKEETLNHPDISIKKEDFLEMTILGQFNQGFILCILERENTRFLITVDQHAADEIYNFEKLQNSFVLKKQNLLCPIDLELTAAQELLIEEYSTVFDKNGFYCKDKKLFSVPVYKSITFTVDDFYSLLENMTNGIYESNKFREIMASKACRSSIMIGRALSNKEMRSVVDNLSYLHMPWNCPHGRPTFKIITKL